MATITETEVMTAAEHEINANIIEKLPTTNEKKTVEKLIPKFDLKQHLQEALQLAAVIHHVFVWVLMPIMSMWVPFYILFCTPLWWTMILYAGWYVYDFRTPARGARKSVSFNTTSFNVYI